MVKDK